MFDVCLDVHSTVTSLIESCIHILHFLLSMNFFFFFQTWQSLMNLESRFYFVVTRCILHLQLGHQSSCIDLHFTVIFLIIWWHLLAHSYCTGMCIFSPIWENFKQGKFLADMGYYGCRDVMNQEIHYLLFALVRLLAPPIVTNPNNFAHPELQHDHKCLKPCIEVLVWYLPKSDPTHLYVPTYLLSLPLPHFPIYFT